MKKSVRRTEATHFDLEDIAVHDHLGERGQRDQHRDQASTCSSVFGLCAHAPRALLLGLKGVLHGGTSLHLRAVVVVGRVLDLGLWRSLSRGPPARPLLCAKR